MAYQVVKVTPNNIRKTLLQEFPAVREMNGKLRVPTGIVQDFCKRHIFIRKVDRLAGGYKRKDTNCDQLFYDLAFYRGDFDVEVNGYRVNGIVPKTLFDKGRSEGLVYSVRFKSEMLEESPEGILYWYIHEKVSL